MQVSAVCENGQPRESTVAMAVIQEYRFELVQHSSEYLLFSKMKRELSAFHYDSDDNIITDVDHFLEVQDTGHQLNVLKLTPSTSGRELISHSSNAPCQCLELLLSLLRPFLSRFSLFGRRIVHCHQVLLSVYLIYRSVWVDGASQVISG